MDELEARRVHFHTRATEMVRKIPQRIMIQKPPHECQTYTRVRCEDDVVGTRPYGVIKSVVDEKNYFITIHHECPPVPLPRCFLQPKMYGFVAPPVEQDSPMVMVTNDRRIHFVLDWKRSASSSATAAMTSSPNISDDTNDCMTAVSEEIPVSLAEIVREDSGFTRPTDTQLFDLITCIVTEMDGLPRSIWYHLTAHGVYILNPSKLGTAKRLHFKLCPFSLGINDSFELPNNVTRDEVHHQSMAIFILKLAVQMDETTWDELLFGLDRNDTRTIVQKLQKRTLKTSYRHPGLITAFAELWSDVLPPPLSPKAKPAVVAVNNVLPSNQPVSLKQRSPTIFAMCSVRTTFKSYKLEHMAGLLEALTCVDSPAIHGPAIAAIWEFILTASKLDVGQAIGIITQCVGLLVPNGGACLENPASSSKSTSWILRMNVIDRILFENERTGDYARLRRVQQTLMEHGIGEQIGGNIVGLNQKFSYKVLMPIVRVSILMSFQFPVMAVRLIFDRNVRKKARMLFEASTPPRADIHLSDVNRFVGMMLVISDFKTWCNKPDVRGETFHDDKRMEDLWHALDDDAFLIYILPCWSASLSDETTRAIVVKLESICEKAVNAYVMESATEKERTDSIRKLTYVMDWLVQFAWNATEQVAISSFQCLYTSYFVGLILRKPGLTVFVEQDVPSLLRPSNEVDVVEQQVATPAIAASFCGMFDDIMSASSSPTVGQQQPTPFTDPFASSSSSSDEGDSSPASSSSSSSLVSEPSPPPHMAALVSTPIAPILDSLVKSLELLDATNPQCLPHVMHTYKIAISPKKLVGIIPFHKDAAVSRYYTPRPQDYGAPPTHDSPFLLIPIHRSDLVYHKVEAVPALNPVAPPLDREPIETINEGNYASIRSLQPDEMYASFEPITLATRGNKLCDTKGAAPQLPGTTGMMAVTIVDSGQTNSLVIGITWDLSCDGSYVRNGPGGIKPGKTMTSVGVSIATGHVYYMVNGKQVKLPYMKPACTKSKVCIGIAYNQVYVHSDGIFYPPIPNLFIPHDVDIYGLVRIGSAGVKLTIRSMTNRWSLERRMDGSFIDKDANPIAYWLHLASVRCHVCPHYHATLKSQSTRPQLSFLLGKGGSTLARLPNHIRELVERVHLANRECISGVCDAADYLRRAIERVVGVVRQGGD